MNRGFARLAAVVITVAFAACIFAGEPGGATAAGSGTATAAGSGTTTATGTTDAGGVSLVFNYDFEKGKDGRLVGWSGSSGIDDFPLDGLTQFWVKRPDKKGMCVKFDTDVYKAEWRKRYDELKADSTAKPWPKTQTVEKKKYSTIGAIDGVRVVSRRIYYKKDATYRLTIELKQMQGTNLKVFVKGYKKIRNRERQVYKAALFCDSEKEKIGEWVTYTRTVSPGKSKGTLPEYLKVHVWAYWPRGIVYVDNVLLFEEKEVKSPEKVEKETDKKPAKEEKKTDEKPADKNVE